jgi:hypothetical protein
LGPRIVNNKINDFVHLLKVKFLEKFTLFPTKFLSLPASSSPFAGDHAGVREIQKIQKTGSFGIFLHPWRAEIFIEKSRLEG